MKEVTERMYGAVLGDIIGSPYEFNNCKAKDFPLFSRNSVFTDDSIMTLAVAKAFLESAPGSDDQTMQKLLVHEMITLAKHYPDRGYGHLFQEWLDSAEHEPYNSFGNGSAMRVSSVAWLYDDLDSVRHAARLSAIVTHNHPEGIKGAEALASAIFIARSRHSKAEVKEYVENEFGYHLDLTCDRLRKSIIFDETCPGSVPEAIIAFLEGESFEDAVRTAVSIGGDSDTIACMAGAIAEGFYGVPLHLKIACTMRLTPELRRIMRMFSTHIRNNRRKRQTAAARMVIK